MIMVVFNLYLKYDDEDIYRTVAEGCSKSQLVTVLTRHLLLAEVADFKIVPIVAYVPFKEFTL